MSLLSELRGKRVLILGFGREGRSTLAFLRERLPDADLAVADRRPPEQLSEQEQALLAALPRERVRLGPDYLEAIRDADVSRPGAGPPA